jgi:UDP-N-acetyl-D-mannosaminuronate dehydrogenase
VLVVGVTYKPGVQDVRESPALAVMAALEDAGCVVGYDDPLIPALSLHGRIVHAERRPRGADWDIAIACTLQPGIDLAYLDDVPLLLDGTYRAGTGHTV